jgi:AcrR family transcriptional regulator
MVTRSTKSAGLDRKLERAPPLPASTRRAPAQQRSRDRLERILSVASSLIAEGGSDLMKMSEVADQAEISIGSLYQYFPDKSAIIGRLAERYHAASRRCIEEALAEVRDLEGLRKAFAGLVDQYYRIFLAEPAMRDVWSGMQADKLMAIEQGDRPEDGALLAEARAPVHPRAPREKIAATSLLVWQLGEATMRLAISVGRREGDALVEAFKRMTLHALSQP